MSIAHRKRYYSPPYQFFIITFFLLGLCNGLVVNSLSVWVGLSPVTSFSSLLSWPGAFELLYPYGVIGLESLCWFWICHNLLRHRLTNRHEHPFKRVFLELLYISFPSLVITLVLYALYIGVFAVTTIALAWLNARFNLNDLPDVLVTAGIVIFIAVSVVMTLMMVGLPVLVYNAAIGRVLFKLPQRRAFILATVIWFVSGLPFFIYSLFNTYTVPSFLPDREQLALEDLRLILFVERAYYQDHQTALEVSALQRYIDEDLPPDAGLRKMRANKFFPRLDHLSGDSADGYRFSIETTGRMVILHAVPVSYGGQTVDSMFCFVAGSGFNARVQDRQGQRATLAGKQVLDLTPDY